MRNLKEYFRNAFADDETVNAEDLQKVELKHSCTTIKEAPSRKRLKLVGRIRSTVYHPGVPLKFEIEIFDGSASLLLIFLGRRNIPGLTSGKMIKVQGTIQPGAERRMYNPRYEILAEF